MSCVQTVGNSPLAMWHAGVEPSIGWISRYKIHNTDNATGGYLPSLDVKTLTLLREYSKCH